MGTLFLSSPDTFHSFPSLAQERENPIRKKAEVLNTAFMQGKGFSFWGEYSNFSPFYALEDQIQNYVSPKPLTRSFKDFSFTQ